MTPAELRLATLAAQTAARGHLRNLAVAFEGGAAVLTGAADNWHAKQLAQEALLQSGVAVRANRIRVLPPAA